MKIPERIKIANLPTRIDYLDKFSKKFHNKKIYIKRDDFTGIEFSGNKIRKLEFSLKEAMDKKCDVLISCGGIQSNHCRAVAAIGAKYGLKVILVLRGNESEEVDGNLLLDKILGAEVKFFSGEEFNNVDELMENIALELRSNGHNPYIIPMGASNGIGLFGYYNAMEEIISQEKNMGLKFDLIVNATGSGGTFGGIILGNRVFNRNLRVACFNVCDDSEYFKKRIHKIIEESMNYTDEKVNVGEDEIEVIDGYVGKGYAISSEDELNFIASFAREEGIILDPVYTGKAMYGLYNELLKGNFKEEKNILFIHTGGLFGLFPKKNELTLV